MQVDPAIDRLLQQPRRGRRRARQGGGMGAWAMGLFLGFAIAIVGVLTGFISQAQLLALFTGASPAAVSAPAASPPASAQESAQESGQVSAQVSAPVAAPVVPAEQQARVQRDETFGDWRFVCVEAKAGAAANCSASQQLTLAETGAPVFVWRILQDGHGGLVGSWQVPAAVKQDAGLTLDAGTPQPVVMPFKSCGEGTCQVVASLTPAFIGTLSSTRTLSASVVLENGQPLKFPLSANGLGAALAALAR